ncbi:hypothetical protein [Methanolobus sp.]|uniref:hypothetical protein n=1 Tax=Methanolobus sp. TaxID=1874737 RepID=UPI0025D9B38F|nr:hypothetical protein [Methanolobus sp.]
MFGWLTNKYVSIFSVEHNNHRLVVLYSGICPVLRNDMLRRNGKMDHGGKIGILGMIMKASHI